MTNKKEYCSWQDTMDHMMRVKQGIDTAIAELKERGLTHDTSKLMDPEKALFDKYTPLLKDSEYLSEDYHKNLEGLKPALDHHYEHNSHHPQHYENGIDGMDLFDILEMYVDWVAAGERTKNGNIHKSIEMNKDRFNMSPQLVNIFTNTANRYDL